MTDRPNQGMSPLLATPLDRRRFLRLSAGSAAALMAAGALVGTASRVRAQSEFDGVTLDLIGLDGEDGQVELEQWRTENGVGRHSREPRELDDVRCDECGPIPQQLA